MTTTHLLRRPEVEARYGRRRTAIYDDIRVGTFPPPVQLGRRCSVWPSCEVDAVIKARIAGQSESEICMLVQRLVAARQRSAA